MAKIQFKFYALTFPSEFNLEQALDFFDSVSTSLKRGSVIRQGEHIVLELWSDKHGLKHRLGIPWQRTELLSQLRTHITGVHIADDERGHIPAWQHAVEIGVSDSTRSFKLDRVDAQVRRLLGASVADLKADDTLLIQLVIAPGDNLALPNQSASTSSWAATALWRGTSASRDEISDRRANAAQNQFRVVLRVAASSETKTHAKKLIDNIRRAYKVPETAHVHFTNQWWLPVTKRIEHINRGSAPGLPYNFINATELAAFSTWPIEAPAIPGLAKGKTRYLPPNEIIEKSGRRLGVSSASGYVNRPIAVTTEGTTRHTYVIGPSGLGKTTLLGNSLQQDIEQGHGVIVFDGKGDLIERALDAVPRERVDDVVYMNFQDFAYPVGFNILQEGDHRSVVDDLMSLFLHNAGGDVYLREVLYHGLHTMRAAGLTVVDLLPFLTPMTPKEEAWRDSVIERLPRNGQLWAYWKAFYALKPTERLQKVRPVQNRLWQITNRADLRNMLGQSQSTISLRDILQDNRILFVAIPQNLGSETVSLLGAIMFDAIWQQVQSLNMTTPTQLYIDEVQRFLNLPIDLNDMLSTARSKKLGITMAHQYTDQLPKELFSAVTNASTKIAFKLEGPDAAKMTNLFGKAVRADDFINLDPYEVIARVATPGGSSDPLTIKTFAAFEGHGLTERIIASSRRNYARRADQVDAEIEARRVAPTKTDRPKPSFGGRLLDEAGE